MRCHKASRKVLDTTQAGPVRKLPAQVEERTIPAKPTGEASLREGQAGVGGQAAPLSVRSCDQAMLNGETAWL